jgi:nucleoside-diphosphate-sugar epimerase
MAGVLIAGCGDVGTTLGLALARDGHTVWGLRRDPRGLSDPIRPLAADLTDPRSLAVLPPDIDRVCYTAAAAGFGEAAYRAAYVDGVRNLLGALAGAPVRRFVFVSSTGVYGQEEGQWVDESSPTDPAGFSGRALLEGERLVGAGPVPGVVLRLGGIYGPGRTRLIDAVRRGEPCVESPPRFTNRIHRDDCAGALRHLLGLADPAPVYLGVDHAPAPECEVMDWIADRLGVGRPPRVPGGPGASPQRGNKRCRNDRLVASGYRFRYPTYREGYAALLGARAP